MATELSTTPDERFAAIVEALLGSPGVTPPSAETAAKQRFGSSALKVDGKIFAMLVKGELVVKLPRQRVEALIAAGAGERFNSGHGRLMKEWLSVPPAAEPGWLPLAREAMTFVGGQR